MPVVRSYLGLGANLGQPRKTLCAAAKAIAALPGTTLRARSMLYQTPAWGVTAQPDFLNAVVMLETALAPLDLLHAVLQIEHQHGRQRDAEQRWGPRTLDIDLLLYADHILDLPGLRVPHPYLHQRLFALVPLLELDRNITIPGIGPAQGALIELLPAPNPPIPMAPANDWSA